MPSLVSGVMPLIFNTKDGHFDTSEPTTTKLPLAD